MRCGATGRAVWLAMLTSSARIPSAALISQPAAKPVAARMPPGAWRYHSASRSRATLVAALAISAALHAGIFFGFTRRAKPAPPRREETTIALTITMPELKDLEEPERVANDDSTPTELTAPVPMQADLPQLPSPNDFVQQIDFSSLLEQPDLAQAKVMVIPDNIRRGAFADGKIKIFNLADLDRVPEPVVQTPPAYPQNLKREGIRATVRVEFIVDVDGRVQNAFVVDSTHPGFNEAAVVGVSRWKFRAGFRAGRKVNTRMQVPIIFRVVDLVD